MPYRQARWTELPYEGLLRTSGATRRDLARDANTKSIGRSADRTHF
jgi:hypothetical protein